MPTSREGSGRLRYRLKVNNLSEWQVQRLERLEIFATLHQPIVLTENDKRLLNKLLNGIRTESSQKKGGKS